MIGDRIKELRSVLKISQEDFAKKLIVSRQSVYYWERGTSLPTDRTIESICREYGVSELWLRTGEGDMFSAVPESTMKEFEMQYHLDELDMEIIRKYSLLSADERAVFKKFLKSFSKGKDGR